jgi:hypothetical protein
MDHRHDRSRDQIPAIADPKRDHRLDVQDVLQLFLRTGVEIEIVLEWNPK